MTAALGGNITKPSPIAYTGTRDWLLSDTVSIDSFDPALSLSQYATAVLQQAAIVGRITSRVQGTVKLGRGVWQGHDIELFPGTRLKGAGNKSIDGLQGTVIQLDDMAAESVLRTFTTGVEVRNITIQDLTISTLGSDVASGFFHLMTALATSDLTFDNVTFIADGDGATLQPQLWLKDPTFSRYCCGITFINCRVILFTTGAAIGWQLDTANSTVWMGAPKFALGGGSKGWYSRQSGSLQVDNALIESLDVTLANTTAADRSIAGKVNISNGGKNLTLTDGSAGLFNQNDIGHPCVITGKLNSWFTGVSYDGLSASVADAASSAAVNGTIDISRYSRNASMPAAGFHLAGNRGCTTFNTSEDEAIKDFLILEGGGDNSVFPVDLNNCVVQSNIRVQNGADVALNIRGGRMPSNMMIVDATSQCDVTVDAGVKVTGQTLYGKYLQTAKLADKIAGPGVYREFFARSIERPVIQVDVGRDTGSPTYGIYTEPLSGWLNDAATSSGAGSYLDGGPQDWDARSVPYLVPSSVLNTFQYGNVLEQTISGLVPFAAYDVDILSGWNGAAFDFTVKINGVYIATQRIGTANGVPAFKIVRGTFRGNANSSGNLVVRLDEAGSGNALMNGLVVRRAAENANGVKVYRAEITQTGTAAPVASVIENTFSGPIVWTRTGAGFYLGTLAGAFTRGQFFARPIDTSSGPAVKPGRLTRNSANIVVLTTAGTDGELVADQSFVEIIVKP